MTRHGKRSAGETPDTALDEVPHEAKEAAIRVTDPEERHRRPGEAGEPGEAGDTNTPAEQAQEESHHD